MEDQKQFFWDRVIGKTFLKLIPARVRPNHLTVLRLLLTPVIVYLFWLDYYFAGLILFIFTAFTDALDGALARARNQITDWGKFYDPLADKLFICSSVYILVLKTVDSWAAWVIIALELFIIVAALVKRKQGEEMQANIWGKLKMNLQVLGVLILIVSAILNVDFLAHFSNGAFYLAIAFAVLSLFTYSI